MRAGMFGLPMALAIIGGMPERFAPLAQLHKEAAARAGHSRKIGGTKANRWKARMAIGSGKPKPLK
jgi:hypothetical protein